MIEVLQEVISKANLPVERIHLLREYLQILILKILYDLRAYNHVAFTGGTALRILNHVQRYSEDLDFSTISDQDFLLEQFSQQLEQKIEQYALPVDTRIGGDVVQSIEIRFKEILNMLGLSPHRGEKLMIRLEIDTNPPSGANSRTELVSRPYLFMVRVFDLPSILAGKLHAILYRRYVKARDYYDLLWFLTEGTIPNTVLLRNAILQTERNEIDPEIWPELLSNKLSQLDFSLIQKDVQPYLKQPDDAQLLTLENFRSLLRKYISSEITF